MEPASIKAFDSIQIDDIQNLWRNGYLMFICGLIGVFRRRTVILVIENS